MRPKPDKPGPGQESVWDYPRPPRLEPFEGSITIELGGQVIASTTRGWRVLETSHPPTYYLPRSAFVAKSLRPADGRSVCEWKGVASYMDLVSRSQVASRAAWFYPTPTPDYAMLVDHLALYAGMVDACYVDDELVVAQPGSFYGGWITSDIVGPFKGYPGTSEW